MCRAVRRPMLAMVNWRTAMDGFFKVRMRRFNRWFVFSTLQDGPVVMMGKDSIFEEWLYFDGHGVPIMYWHRDLNGVMLLG
jgi:hypothetical protein